MSAEHFDTVAEDAIQDHVDLVAPSDGEEEGAVNFSSGMGVSHAAGDGKHGLNDSTDEEINESDVTEVTTNGDNEFARQFDKLEPGELTDLLRTIKFQYSETSKNGCIERMTFFMRDVRSWISLFNARFSDSPSIVKVKKLSTIKMRNWTARMTLVRHMSEVLEALGCKFDPVHATDVMHPPISVLFETASQFLEWCKYWWRMMKTRKQTKRN
jgi:hypothetical protein